LAKAHVLFWFDVEDCSVPQSDDAAKRIAQILSEHGIRGTMKVVGQKARVLRDRVRYDVIDALGRHDIGYHSNWHGLRPQVAEYLAPLGWEAGVAEFDHRERPGLADVAALLGQHPVCYGQPGPNWAPHVFPVLRRWGVPAYISGFGYVSIDAQPFWYGGVLNTSHMAGPQGRRHLGLNFELGSDGALAGHVRAFDAAVESLGDAGGLITVMNHPCTLVLEEWFSTRLKPAHLTEAGYRDFDGFVRHVLGSDGVEVIDAPRLLELYPDAARGRTLGRDELLALARAVGGEVVWQELDGAVLSAAEVFGLLVRALAGAADGAGGESLEWQYLDGPAQRLESGDTEFSIKWEVFVQAVKAAASFCATHGRVPDEVRMGSRRVFPGDFLATAAEAAATLLGTGRSPERVTILSATDRVADYVDEEAARGGWASAMLPDGFRAPALVELARLQAWTLKPAIPRDG